MFVWGSMRAVQGDQTSSPDALARFLTRCVEVGCTGLDAADIYNGGRSETLIGQAFRIAPELVGALPVIAKAGVVFADPSARLPAHHYRNDPAHLRDSLDASLNRLGLEQVDTFLVHRPDYLMRFEETAKFFEDVLNSGKAKRIGVSNFSKAQIEGLSQALAAPIEHHQLEFSVLETAPLDTGLLDPACLGRQTLTAWSPLAGGRLFKRDDPQASRVCSTIRDLIGTDDPDAIAGAALAWIARHPSKPIPILGGTDIARIEKQVAAIKATELTSESWYGILEASRGYPAP
jgi:predicted oxidoreductase